MNDTSEPSMQESTGRAKHSVSGPIQIAHEHWALLHSSSSPPLPQMKQYYNGQNVTIGAQTVSARLFTSYDYGTLKVSLHISHGQSSQSA